MELTTLAFALLFGLGLLAVDSVMHSGSVEVAIAPKIEAISVDEQTLVSRFKDLLDEITSTPSVVRPPEIRSRLDQGLAWRCSRLSMPRISPSLCSANWGATRTSSASGSSSRMEQCMCWWRVAATWSALSAK